jgi:thaumarchaeosortase
MWKGRTFQLFFIWLVALEFILSWETIKLKINRQNKASSLAFGLVLLLPTLFVVLEYYFGLNGAIANWALQSGIAAKPFSDSMPLAIEYLVFSILFSLTVFLSFGKKGLTGFALPALFVGLVGVLYTIDNVFPYGQFTPFQLLVPTTASLAAGVLSLMGNTALLGTDVATGMPLLDVTGPLGTAKFTIAWPCAGIESLLIFTAVALLFLKRMNISWKVKTWLLCLRCSGDLLINVLRIANLFILGTQFGVESSQVQSFHFYLDSLCDGVDYFLSDDYSYEGGMGKIRNRKAMKLNDTAKPANKYLSVLGAEKQHLLPRDHGFHVCAHDGWYAL